MGPKTSQAFDELRLSPGQTTWILGWLDWPIDSLLVIPYKSSGFFFFVPFSSCFRKKTSFLGISTREREREMARIEAILLLSALVLVSSLPVSRSSKKPAAIARKEDIPFIKCQVCQKLAHQLHHQVNKKQTQISPKKVSFSHQDPTLFTSLDLICIWPSGSFLFSLISSNMAWFFCVLFSILVY